MTCLFFPFQGTLSCLLTGSSVIFFSPVNGVRLKNE